MTGFQKLLCLGLDRTPASDLIEGTVMAWMEALTDGRHWDEGRDRERIRRAFVTLARTRRQWPAPADFLEALPRIEPLRALPKAAADPARAAACIAEARRLLQGHRDPPQADRKTMAAGGDA